MFEILLYVPLISVCAIPLWVPLGTPAIVTTLFVSCKLWFGWNTLTTPEVSVVLIGFCFSVLASSVLFARWTVPVTWLNSALLIVNLISSFCSVVQVEPFCDLNNTPAYGCDDIVLFEPMFVSPSLPT